MQLEEIAVERLSKSFGITNPYELELLRRVVETNHAGIADTKRNLRIRQADQIGNTALSNAITEYLTCPEAYHD